MRVDGAGKSREALILEQELVNIQNGVAAMSKGM
jgi:hypothetical protein